MLQAGEQEQISHELTKATTLTLHGMQQSGHLRRLLWGQGEVGCFESSELAHLDYALVSITYAAQGKSAERVIGALDRYVGGRAFMWR